MVLPDLSCQANNLSTLSIPTKSYHCVFPIDALNPDKLNLNLDVLKTLKTSVHGPIHAVCKIVK